MSEAIRTPATDSLLRKGSNRFIGLVPFGSSGSVFVGETFGLRSRPAAQVGIIDSG